MTGLQAFLADPDVTLYHGDAVETLRQLPDGCVDMVATSPPFYGLRDYGTGTWEGGDPECDHTRSKRTPTPRTDGGNSNWDHGNGDEAYGATCGKCGARRVDRQIGLEETPSCGRHGLMQLRSDLTPDQRAYVAQRLLGVEIRDE